MLQLLPNFEIVAVSSRRQEAAEEMAREFSLRYALTDSSELISHPEVDLVVVLSPAPHHAALVRTAIAAGKDVYCEWPLTTTLADAEDLFALAQKGGWIPSSMSPRSSSRLGCRGSSSPRR